MTAETALNSPISPHMVSICLDHLVKALEGRPGCVDAARIAKSQSTKTLILGMEPKTGVELMLAGHAVLFLSVAAVTAEDLAAQSNSPGAARTRSALIALGRISGKNLDTLARLQNPGPRRAKASVPPPVPVPDAVEPDVEVEPAPAPAGPASATAPALAEPTQQPEAAEAAQPSQTAEAAQPPHPPRPSREVRRREKKLALRAMRAALAPPDARSRDGSAVPALQPGGTPRG